MTQLDNATEETDHQKLHPTKTPKKQQDQTKQQRPRKQKEEEEHRGQEKLQNTENTKESEERERMQDRATPSQGKSHRAAPPFKAEGGNPNEEIGKKHIRREQGIR